MNSGPPSTWRTTEDHTAFPLPRALQHLLEHAALDFVSLCVAALLSRWETPATPTRATISHGRQRKDVCAHHTSVDVNTTPRAASAPRTVSCDPARCGEPTLHVTLTEDRTAMHIAMEAAQGSADTWGGAITTLLDAALTNPAQPWSSQPVMSPQQHTYLLHQLNHHRDPHITAATLADPFADQAALHPGNVALVTEHGENLTYGQLHDNAQRLARHLAALGCQQGTRVGIAQQRGIAQLIAIYASALCGATYVPLDLDQPPARLEYILTDSRPRIVIADAEHAATLPTGPWRICLFDELTAAEPELDTLPTIDLAGPGLIAHVLYTSGTTGRPKGVATSTGSALANIDWMQHRYPYRPGDTAIYKTSAGFDVSIWEIFWPLYHGARLLVTNPNDHRDPARLADLITRFSVKQIFLVPSVIGPVVDQLGPKHPPLQTIISGGETHSTHLRARVYDQLPTVTLVNAYGPCEAGSVTDAIAPPSHDPAPIPVGTPAPNFRLSVLDRTLQPVPLGVTGEAYIGGHIGIAYGYWGQPARTAERFVADPWGPPGARIYRTGDLCRFAPDGRLVHLGRIDRQVKIRGHRVEPAEVEAVLLLHPAIADSAVIVDPTTGSLVAVVVVVAGTTPPGPEALIQHARTHLPAHAVPEAILVVDDLPTTVNDKLDTAHLLTRLEATRSTDTPAPPQGTPAQARPSSVLDTLMGIYAAVLGKDHVEPDDSFVDLGGHSLLAFKLLDECQALLDVKPEIPTLLNGSISEVADHLVHQLQPDRSPGVPSTPHEQSNGATT